MGKASRAIRDPENLSEIQEYLKCHNERDYIIFIIGLRTGYRMQDIVDLKIKDIKKALVECRFVIEEKKRFRNYEARKNNKTKGYSGEAEPRIVNFKRRELFYKVLEKYIAGKPSYDYAFKSKKGEYIKVDSYARILKKAGEYFKIYNLGAHTPRKTFAYNLYNNTGKNLTLVQLALGHSSPKTTIRYIGVEEDIIDECSEELDDLICV